MSKSLIDSSLKNFSKDDFLKNSIELFKSLGYISKRTYAVSSIEDFKTKFLQSDFNKDKLIINDWKNAQFLFELQVDDLNSEDKVITGGKVNDKDIEAYWFIAIELKNENYTKKQLSDITREINKQRPIPVFILFKYSDNLTFSIIDRRINKKDNTKDVLQKVVLIKDIKFNKHHRAHLDILNDISFENIRSKYNVTNFVELHLNWLKALSVSELNKKFYTELSNWFFWMIDTCQLSQSNLEKDNVMFGIRMVTRIIFNWFIKEKGLVPEDIFKKETYLNLLKPEYKEQGDLYYKVILQNLFFGCLSKPMDRRGFRSQEYYNGKNKSYGVKDLYRYEKYLNNKDELLNLFKEIPFLNGGLFECTDNPDYGKRSDCFTDVEARNFLKISDDIFFMENEREVDLSAHFEKDKNKYKNAKVRGLFEILNSYKFTIDETTPIEEEIALDPELLGRVFENLLAAHNPETKVSARKSTGSYYTPREIVDYMCEQSLLNYLKTQVEPLNITDIDEKLKELLSYSETHSFSDNEIEELIKAINNVRILDPACGSGAFPMGLLHKLVHILSKLDPNNEKWKEEQIETVNLIDDLKDRDEAINVIEQQFNDNEKDYSRKLYLIQNCIFGVDIQPMATQISRLRFFISLIIDEKHNKADKNNKGIIPLPNLETKFVAANSLLDLPFDVSFLDKGEVKVLKKKLEQAKQHHFRANTRQTKKKWEEEDRNIRAQIRTFSPNLNEARILEEWSPYDKDNSVNWFNPKWMFNVEKFDIVIGNPPYGVSIKGDYRKNVEKFLAKVPDYEIYYYFIEIAYKIIKEKGTLSYIIPNTWLFNTFAENYRKKILDEWNIKEILDCSKFEIFESATVRNTINLFEKGISKNIGYRETKNIVSFTDLINQPYIFMAKENLLMMNQNWSLAFLLDKTIVDLISKIKTNNKPLNIYFPEISQGLIAYDKYKGQSEEIIKNRAYHYNEFSKPNLKKWLWGQDVSRYNIKWNEKEWIDYCDGIANPREPKFFKGKRLLIREITNPSIYAAITSEEQYNDPSILIILDNQNKIEIALGILNSKLATFYHFNNSPKAIKGAFPKILVKDIKEFPLPNVSLKKCNELTNLVNKIVELTSIENYSEDIEKQRAVQEYENQIDLMVYKLYELTYAEVLTIDKDFSMPEEEYNNYQI